MYVIYSHFAYLALSIGLTIWVARTLSKSGRVFLVDAFLGNRELAEAVNHLLVVGFYLINVGFVALALKYGDRPNNLETAIESLSTKEGFVLLVLGGMHFFNLWLFSKLRKRSMLRSRKPPVAPDEMVEPVAHFAH